MKLRILRMNLFRSRFNIFCQQQISRIQPSSLMPLSVTCYCLHTVVLLLFTWRTERTRRDQCHRYLYA